MPDHCRLQSWHMTWYALDDKLFLPFLHAFLFPLFWQRFILVSLVQTIRIQRKWEAFSNKSQTSNLTQLQCYWWFAPNCKPSIFTFMKESLDRWLWQWTAYLLKCLLDFCWHCKGMSFFIKERILHLLYLLWSSRLFDFVELIPEIAFFLRTYMWQSSAHQEGSAEFDKWIVRK